MPTSSRTLCALLLALALGSSRGAATAPIAADPTTAQQLLREGVALHDQGDYDGALAKYRQILALDPQNASALYESSLTLFAKEDWKGCIAIADQGLRLDTPAKVGFYVSAGNCRDGAGDNKGAIKLLEKGRREFPDNAGLAFNLGVAYSVGGQTKKAIETLEATLRDHPAHPSANYILGQLYEGQHQRIPAFLAYLYYLGLDAESPRAKLAAEAVQRLLMQGISAKSEKEVELAVPIGGKHNDLDASELFLSLQASTRHIDENKGKTDLQFLAASLTDFTSMCGEVGLAGKKGCFACRQYLPFLQALKSKAWIEPFTYLALASLEPAEADRWKSSHGVEVAALRKWLAGE